MNENQKTPRMGRVLEEEPLEKASRSAFLASANPARIREQLDEILSSPTFRGAEREKTLLRYVVEKTLQGLGQTLKEYTVGVEAFDRGDGFDPRRDTIVRTEARNVRLRLTRYYEREGENDRLRIELPKGGYVPRFVEPLQPFPDPIEKSVAEVPQPQSAASLFVRPSRSVRFKWMLLSGGALIAILAVGWLWSVRASSLSFGWPRGANTPDAASIAVLPFENRSGTGDKDGEILSDGLMEELIDSLARRPSLHVVARSSTFAYKGSSADVRRVGRELGVRNVLEGSVRIVDGRVRITVQLEDATDGSTVWSQSFNRRLENLLAIQGEISMAIMQSLGVQLIGAANLRRGATPSPAAYQDFLRGLYFLNRSTAENTRTAINYFERAVAADPEFAPAYRGLADANAKIAAYTSTPSRDVVPRIRAAALRALQLDDNLGEAHLDLARAYTYESNWTTASVEYQRALQLSPSSADVHRAYGDYLLRIGRLEEALAEGRIALELDPISPSAGQFVAKMLYFLRRYDDALSQVNKALELNPASGILHQLRGLVFMTRPATYAAGVVETERARELMEGDPWITGQLGYADALAGRTVEARAILRTFESRSQDYLRALPVARVYAGLGDRDTTLLWLKKAVDQRDVSLYLIADPVYDFVRDDPRFIALLQQANLAAILGQKP